MLAREVSLFFDVVSPYTHINLHTWARYVQRWGPSVSLALRPIFLGGVMKATGNKPPGLLPSRMRFMSQDIGRACAMSDIPILPIPSNFMSEVAREVVKVQRLVCAAQLRGLEPAEQLRLVLACSDSIHATPGLRTEDDALRLDDAFLASVRDRSGLDSSLWAELLAQAGEAAAKDLLQSNTDEAVARGAFGSPTLFVPAEEEGGREQLFFGSDRMEQLAFTLKLPYEGPKPRL